MLKGAQKQMIVVRTRNSRLFEEAYFVMRRGVGREADELDMLWEANRIIESSLPAEIPAKAPAGSRIREPHTAKDRSSDADAAMPMPAPAPQTKRAARDFRLAAGLVWFFMGFLSGGGLMGLLWLILS